MINEWTVFDRIMESPITAIILTMLLLGLVLLAKELKNLKK